MRKEERGKLIRYQIFTNSYLDLPDVAKSAKLFIVDKSQTNFSIVAVHCRDPPKTVFDQTLAHIYHKGDIAKLEILMTYGGIYLDTDVLVLRSMDRLRKHPLTSPESLSHIKMHCF